MSALLDSFSQNAVAREMGQQEIHLVSQDFAALQVDVFRMCRREWNGQQFHPCLFRCPAGFVVIAAFACGDHVSPGIQTVLAQGFDMVT